MGHTFRPQEPLAQGELPPPRIAWLHPLELLRTAYHAWLSQVATSFLDRRETLAALDRNPPGLDQSEHDPAEFTDPKLCDRFFASPRHKTEGVWIDFVADLGDSWEATHAIAALMAQRKLKVHGRDEELPHADLVVLGGDLVYPSPTRDSYRRRTRQPIGSALPQRDVHRNGDATPRPRRMVAIPGNHDWYDGLTSFVREFCQGGWLGGWQLVQMRSYFALKLMPGWWVWGIDIALDTRIDPAQQNFFLDVLNNVDPEKHGRFEWGDNIVLCTAKPSWLRLSRYSDDAYRNLAFFVREIIGEHGGQVPVILSGDLHHYSRYQREGGYQLITSGSGGSYLMGTHQLPPSVPPLESAPTQPASPSQRYVRGGFPYPSRADSRRLALGALKLAFRRANVPFCLAVGAIYWWQMRMVDRVFGPRSLSDMFEAPVTWSFVALLSTLVIVVGCASFARAANSRSPRLATLAWGATHGVAHLALALVAVRWLTLNPVGKLAGESPYFDWEYEQLAMWLSAALDFSAVALVMGWVGATLVGVYLTVSDRVLRWHQNEVFAAQSIMDYRSFVRLHLRPDGVLKIYSIGLRRVPRQWRSRLDRTDSDPYYEPTDANLTPHLIEGPITIETARTGWTPPVTPFIPVKS